MAAVFPGGWGDGGRGGAVFHLAISYVTELRGQHGWILYLLPLAGLLIVWAYHVTGMADDKGTEYIIGAVREGRILRIRTAPLIFIGTVLTHLCGGSAGREGAALQLGGSMSNFLGRWCISMKRMTGSLPCAAWRRASRRCSALRWRRR